MKTRILREIAKNVQFRTAVLENGKKEYLVERRHSVTGEWDVIAKTTKIERALVKKHNEWVSQLTRLNLSGKLLNRRSNGKGTFWQLLMR